MKRPAAAANLGERSTRVPVHNIYQHTMLDVYWSRPAVGLKMRDDGKQALYKLPKSSFKGFYILLCKFVCL